MRFYTCEHSFYCGIDLHARTMHLCILDHAGQVVFDDNLPTNPRAFLEAITPYRQGIIVGAECMFSWYWLADLCHQQNIDFVLGHALYMRLIHGGKGKNDRIDAGKIARLLRTGGFPLAYAYPKGMRETRDLLRRRSYLVRQRGSLLTHIQIVNSQYNLLPIGKELRYEGKRTGIAERFPEGAVRKNIAVDLHLIRQLDALIDDLEEELVRTVQVEDRVTFELLRSIPGVGPILGLTLLYELHDWRRFATVGQFLSYARLVRCVHESAGKKLGTGNSKIGNAHLRWAFAEAACQMLRVSERARRWKERYQQGHGKGKGVSVLAARLGRAVYHMLRKGEEFDEARFWNENQRDAEPRSRPASKHDKAKRVRRKVKCA